MNYGNIAETLIVKNRDKSGRTGTSVLEKAVNAAERTAQYKAVEPHITARLVATIGKAEGRYIQRNKLIWDIVDYVNGNEGSGLKY